MRSILLMANVADAGPSRFLSAISADLNESITPEIISDKPDSANREPAPCPKKVMVIQA